MPSERYNETLANIDESISAHVKANKNPGSIVTGWVMVASVSHPESLSRDGYVMQSSSSLPHHTQLGLLNMAIQDKSNMSIISTMRAMMEGDD